MTKVCTIYLVRHAKAGDRAGYDGDDTLRPLSGKGRRQAVAICERLSRLIVKLPDALLLSSPYIRCIQTLEPLAAERHAVIQTENVSLRVMTARVLSNSYRHFLTDQSCVVMVM